MDEVTFETKKELVKELCAACHKIKEQLPRLAGASYRMVLHGLVVSLMEGETLWLNMAAAGAAAWVTSTDDDRPGDLEELSIEDLEETLKRFLDDLGELPEEESEGVPDYGLFVLGGDGEEHPYDPDEVLDHGTFVLHLGPSLSADDEDPDDPEEEEPEEE